MKPAGPGLITANELDIMDILDDYMCVGFSVNVRPFLQDTLDVLSWDFASSYSEAMPAPTLMGSRQFSKRVLLIGAACSAAIVLAVIYLLGYWRIKQPHIDKPEPGLELDLPGLQRFSFKELKKATENLNEGALLGKGGSGSVYRGTVRPSGMVVAVKRLNHDSEHVHQEFLAEVSSISQICHRNFVHLLGWRHEDGHISLVCEYMSNGSLDEWLFPSRRRHRHDPKYKRFEVLPWEMRFSILAGVAATVEYLHEEWVQCMLHRNTSPCAALGLLMQEFLCGKRPVNLHVEDPDDDFMLVQIVWRAHEGGNILSALDPGLQFSRSSTAASTQISPFTNTTCERVPINEVGPKRSPVLQHVQL